ncbi:MAG TPA: RodZ domain-containing protein [Candidatus Cryosericum sp.]
MDRQQAGTALRDKRMSLELSLEDVARATLLRKSMLESLEAGGPPDPNGFFKSYARRYAEYLGLNGDDVVAAFVGSSPTVTTDSDAVTAQPTKLGRSVAAVPAYKKKRSLVSTVLIIVVALVTAVVLLSRPWAATPGLPGGQTGPSSTPSVPSGTTDPSLPGTPSIPDTTPVVPTQGAITLRFTSTTQRAWLEITVDGSVVFSGILSPGDSTQATGNYVVVNFGNAMHTQVTANGVDQGVASPDKTVMTLEYGSPAHTP